jgi:hypothetical protein
MFSRHRFSVLLLYSTLSPCLYLSLLFGFIIDDYYHSRALFVEREILRVSNAASSEEKWKRDLETLSADLIQNNQIIVAIWSDSHCHCCRLHVIYARTFVHAHDLFSPMFPSLSVYPEHAMSQMRFSLGGHPNSYVTISYNPYATTITMKIYANPMPMNCLLTEARY